MPAQPARMSSRCRTPCFTIWGVHVVSNLPSVIAISCGSCRSHTDLMRCKRGRSCGHLPDGMRRVLQVKILMEEATAGTPSTRAPKSRGRGFIEFTEHEHALCALRQLNNNPQPFGEPQQHTCRAAGVHWLQWWSSAHLVKSF